MVWRLPVLACTRLEHNTIARDRTHRLPPGPFTALRTPGYAEAGFDWETASYIKDNTGRVHLRGLMQSSPRGAKPAGATHAAPLQPHMPVLLDLGPWTAMYRLIILPLY